MADIYESHQGSLAVSREAAATQPGQVGAAFLVGGRLVGTGLFDAPSTLAHLLPKLVNTYTMDALEERNEGAGYRQGLSGDHAAEQAVDTAQAFIQRVKMAHAEQYPAGSETKGWGAGGKRAGGAPFGVCGVGGTK